MTDIVERLRSLAAIDNCQTSLEAAAEIERLRAALDEIIPFAVYSLAEMNKERNTKPIEKAIAKAVAALTAQPAEGEK
jgi:hypothetical protein